MNNYGLPKRYEFQNEIGSGAMGTVIKVHDSHLDRILAIKFVSSDFNYDESKKIQRFQREAKTAGKLNHENLVSVLDFGVADNGRPYLVMEYIEGDSLDKLIANTNGLAEELIIDCFVQVASGMAHAHASGVVHRDLKSTNILCTYNDEGEPIFKVIDFGIALGAEDGRLTSTNAIIGSPLYMSPEQASGKEADKRSDVYSFGCIMYEAITGSTPFKGDTAIDTMNLHVTSDAEAIPFESLNYDLVNGSKLDSVIRKCLQKDPEDRFQHMGELEAELFSMFKDIEVNDPTEVEANEQKTEPKAIEIPNSKFFYATVILVFVGIVGVVFGRAVFYGSEADTSIIPVTKFDDSILKEDPDEVEMENALKNLDRKYIKRMRNPLINDKWTKKVCEKLRRLEEVKLETCPITDESLKYLSEKPLTKLELVDVNVTDEGISYLKNMTTLKELDLSKTEVTKEGIMELVNMASLKNLKLNFCENMSKSDIDMLRKKLPNCKIESNHIR